jgi:hypothetical protein
VIHGGMNKVALVVMGLALAAGCKKKDEKPAATPPPTPAVDAPPAIDAAVGVADAAPPALTPAVPAGKVGVQILDLEYAGIATPGLPAISTDGKQFAVAIVGDDGGRGFLDLRLRTIDATTAKMVKEWRLADPDKTNGDGSADGPAPAVLDAAKAAVAEANTALAATEWRSLTPVTLPPDTDKDAATTLTAGDTKFTYDDGKLTIAKDGAKPIVKTYQEVTGEKPPTVSGDGDDCKSATVYLSSVAVDPPSKHALVGFGFVTGHNCGGAPVYGVVALP